MASKGSIAISAWLVATGVGCYGGPDYVLPRVGDATDLECYSFDCAIALGSEVDADAYIGTDYTEYATIASATVEPPTLADVTIADHAFTLHALAEGTGVLHVVTTEKTTIDQPIRVTAPATTTVIVAGIPPAVDPLGPFDVIGAPVLHLIAIHRDATNARLLGHGIETWTATGADLAEVPADSYGVDNALMRDLTLTAPSASVTAGGATLALSIVLLHSTARLAFAVDHYVLPGPVFVQRGQTAAIDVLAYGADDRFIVDPGLPSVTVSDPSVATAEPNPYRSSVNVTGRAIGHATLTVDLDGAQAPLDVDVTH